MTFQVHRYCSKCYTFESKRFIKCKDKDDAYLCTKCYSSEYNRTHRIEKNTKARLRARLLKTGTRTKSKKKPTKSQALAEHRHLTWQLRKAQEKISILEWLHSPPIPTLPTNIWSTYPGVT